MKLKQSLTQYQEKVFDWATWISYALIVVSAFGLSQSAPKYLSILDFYVRTYICLFLIWRFNPYRQVVFTELDQKIAFNAGLFILTTAVLKNYFDSIKGRVEEKVAPVRDKLQQVMEQKGLQEFNGT
jgi:hypothetical protein